MKERLIDTVKGAVEVNLKYSAIVLNLAKEYVKDFDRLVRDGTPASEAGGQSAPTQPAPAPPPRRPPILLVGELNEEASGAFALNNTSPTELHVSLLVQGELAAGQVQLVPKTFVLAPGTGAFVRIKVRFTKDYEEDRDYAGAIVAPGLSSQAIEFLVRRLPSQTGAHAAKPGKKAPSSRTAD